MTDHPDYNPADCRWKGQPFGTMEQLGRLRCPFDVSPEAKDSRPAYATTNLHHLVAGQDGAPFTAYYAIWRGAKFAVTNVYGVWFEFQRVEDRFEAHRCQESLPKFLAVRR